jgi:hypothetical protein
MGFLSDSKDRLMEKMALPIVNRSFLAPYGQARELRIDTTNKTAEILVDLKGETQPLRVQIGSYEFSKKDGELFVTIHAIKTSREWLTALAQRYLIGQALKLPAEFGGVLTRLM